VTQQHHRRLPFSLDERDLHIVQMLAEGYTGKQIAAAVGISTKNTHMLLSRARARFGATSSCHLIAILFRTGLLL